MSFLLKSSSSAGALRRLRMSSATRCRQLSKRAYLRLDELGLDGVLPSPMPTAFIWEIQARSCLSGARTPKECRLAIRTPLPIRFAPHAWLTDNLIDFTTDTNRVVAEMHYTNRFARTPSVRYISPCGGSIP